jgi:hypothetical protein
MKPKNQRTRKAEAKLGVNLARYIQGASKKTGIMEFCIFCIIKVVYTIKITVSNTCMITSIQ